MVGSSCEVMWQSCDSHVTVCEVMWQSVTVMWGHVTVCEVIWQSVRSCDSLWAMWQSCDGHVTVMWRSVRSADSCWKSNWGSWLELPVLYHWATTAGRLPASIWIAQVALPGLSLTPTRYNFDSSELSQSTFQSSNPIGWNLPPVLKMYCAHCWHDKPLWSPAIPKL